MSGCGGDHPSNRPLHFVRCGGKSDVKGAFMRKLHPKLIYWLERNNALVAKLIADGFRPTPVNAREGLAGLTRIYVKNIPDVAQVQDDYVITPNYHVPVRIYNPKPDEALPILIYFHGGGHMAGSVTVYDPICRKLALAADHIVVAPEYRLSPECPYPAGITDAFGVAKYLWKTLDDRQIKYKRVLSVGGDSGGGAMTATVTGRAQFDGGLSIHKQFMIYPSLDYTMSTPGIEENAVGYLLQKDKLIWYFDAYFQHGEDRKAASPLFWDFTRRLPETLMITAEFCPLRDEGIRYVEKAGAAGVPTQHLHFDDMIHTFINMEDVVPDACRKVYDTVGAFLKA